VFDDGSLPEMTGDTAESGGVEESSQVEVDLLGGSSSTVPTTGGQDGVMHWMDTYANKNRGSSVLGFFF
jgi:hypothetical protein